MADIFISYAREDLRTVANLAEALISKGFGVFWDRDIPPGQSFYDVIVDELKHAKCVIVLWSASSVTSPYVRDEAEDGRSRGLLIPALLEPIVPPLGFRQDQFVDLSAWTGAHDQPGFLQLLTAVTNFTRPSHNLLRQVEKLLRKEWFLLPTVFALPRLRDIRDEFRKESLRHGSATADREGKRSWGRRRAIAIGRRHTQRSPASNHGSCRRAVRPECAASCCRQRRGPHYSESTCSEPHTDDSRSVRTGHNCQPPRRFMGAICRTQLVRA